MWTPEQRRKQTVVRKARRRGYPTDVKDEEWHLIEPLLPPTARTGRPRQTDLRAVINALRYMVRAGCEWRMLPNDFPPWETVYYWFRRLMRRMLFKTIHDLALMIERQECHRDSEPTAGVLDSQSVKAPHAQHGGYDAGKKVNGRKRHIAVDTDGRLLMVNLTTADTSDTAGAQKVLKAVKMRWPWLRHLFADSAYDRAMLMDKAALLDFGVEVVRKLEDQHTFVPLRRRCVVERSCGWMVKWRRRVRDYERRNMTPARRCRDSNGILLLIRKACRMRSR
jgi:putative transposase